MYLKRSFYLCAIFFGFISCEKEEIPTTIPYEETRFVITEPLAFEIPSIIGLNLPFEIPFLDVPLDFSTASENTNPDIGLIRNIKLRDFVIRIMSPQSQSFSFLKDIDVYISAPGLPEVKMAHHSNVDDGIGAVLHLVPEGEILDQYLKSESFDLRLDIVADQLIFTDLTIEGEWVLDVELINNP